MTKFKQSYLIGNLTAGDDMKKIDANLYVYEYTSKIMPGVDFPVRCTAIELENKEVLLISPGPFDQETIRGFMAGYSSVYCAAPNSQHHRHLRRFKELVPEAGLYGPPALIKKQPRLSGKMLGLEQLEPSLKGQVQMFPIAGNPFLDETVFYDVKSRSLIVTDLLFNMREPMPLGRKLVLGMVGAKDKIAQSRLVRKTTGDREAYDRSIRPIGKLDIQRIIVGHGNLIEEAAEVKTALEAIGAL